MIFIKNLSWKWRIKIVHRKTGFFFFQLLHNCSSLVSCLVFFASKPYSLEYVLVRFVSPCNIPLCCPLCDFPYSSVFEIDKHQTEAHQSVVVAKKCMLCSASFRTDILYKFVYVFAEKNYRNSGLLVYYLALLIFYFQTPRPSAYGRRLVSGSSHRNVLYEFIFKRQRESQKGTVYFF